MAKRKKPSKRRKARGIRTRKKRNYKAEYRRRVRLAKKRGLSKAQMRGHPRKGELGIKQADKLKVQPISRDIILGRRRRVIFKDKQAGKPLYPIPAGPPIRKPGRLQPTGREGYRLKPSMPMPEGPILDITNQKMFVEYMMKLGFSEREAFSKWFSP